MAKRPQTPINVTSYITINERPVKLADLTKYQRNFVGAKLRLLYLNGLYAGKAEFSSPNLPDDKTIFGGT
jgi:hypothetical protein